MNQLISGAWIYGSATLSIIDMESDLEKYVINKEKTTSFILDLFFCSSAYFQTIRGQQND